MSKAPNRVTALHGLYSCSPRRAEGVNLSKKNGDLEAGLRKLRSSSRDVESERDKLLARVKALEQQLLEGQEKSEKDIANASTQVGRCKGGEGPR